MIVEYELSNPYVQGVTEGWCLNWNQGSDQDPGDSFWINLTEEECWKHCNDDFSCFQVGLFSGKYHLNISVVIYSKFYYVQLESVIKMSANHFSNWQQ